jgi:hypothetical protein
MNSTGGLERAYVVMKRPPLGGHSALGRGFERWGSKSDQFDWFRRIADVADRAAERRHL